ncbi:hypothetical protein L915_16188 [Phytophthora nicotianae]|uniref:Uncharacterized protein n=1 Tax=Phytophthora nicotianae TaxID=4792 RepID=W2G5U2_PHYNI|nr:hypothetical protein L915_16188 [Phytophthora nicotianae]
MGSASLVAPIIAIILQHVRFNLDEWTESEIEDTGSTILNRILGRSGYSGTNLLPDVLESTMAEEAWPIASQECFWVDPGSGEQAEFTLQHALDFAYYVDGGVEPIPGAIRESFCRPPVQQLRQELPSKSAKNIDEDQLAGLFDPFVDDDDGLPVGPSVDEQARPRPHEHAASKKRSRDQPSEFEVLPHGTMTTQRQRTALDHDALIVEKLSGDPELLDRFLQVREASGKQNGIAREGNRRSTDLDVEEKRVGPTSKYAFVPREGQQRVHERVTAVRHKESSAAKPATSVNEVVDAARVFLTYTREYCCAELVELVE